MSELDLKPTFESARGKFLDFLRWYKDNRRQRNEATTRLHLIDTLFFDCLDWVKLADCECEEPHGREYADYVFKCPIRTMIVEAKKEGKYFDIPSGKQRRTYSLSHLTSSLPDLKAAVEQVSAYCQSRGVAIAVVTNGHQIVAFIGSRDDGRPPLSGRAIVFESLDAIANDFITFWNTLSKDGITERHIYRYLLGDTIAPRPPKPSELLLDYPGIQQRNIMQADLQNLASLIIHDIPSADETQDTFAKECYCPSNALSQYSVIGRQFLESRYQAIFEHAPDAPAMIPATTKKGISKLLTAESIYRRPILLIGDVGVGKTTFIKQFISVEAKHVFDNALTIYVDFGSKAAFDPNIPNFLLNDIEHQLLTKHNVDIMEDRFVRGVYNLELQRFRKGIYSRLVTQDPDRYYERELDRLSQLTSQKDAHLVKSLEHISLGRQKQIVIFLDNVDQRSDDVQQKVFVMAHSIASEWPAAIFVAIRPETYNRSKRDGALSGYHTKVFTIAPPRIDLVLKKRLQFGLRVTSGMIPVAILQQATKDSVRNLEIFLKVMQQSFEYNDNLVELIDNIAGGNVRLALELIEGFVGSGHIDTRKIIDAYNSRGGYRIPVHELLRTIMHGNNRYYAPISTPIVNIFDIILPDKKEHFLTYSLLSWLRHNASIGNHGFVPLEQLYNYAQKNGFQVMQINYAIERMCKFNLAETSGRVQPIGSDPRITSMRVTQSGVYHIAILANKFNYIDTMIVDTPILEKSFEERINITTTSIRIRLQRTNIFLDYLDECWREYESNDEVISWELVSKEARANAIHIEQLIAR